MDLLDKLVLPQSAHHMVLIKYLLVLSNMLLVPYLSVLTGSLIFSLFFKHRAEKTNNTFAYRFAKELVDLVTFNKSVSIALGIVPLISSAFGYAQLLHLSNVNVSNFLFLSALFLLAALIMIFTFKYSFHFKDIFKAADEKGVGTTEYEKEEISKYSTNTNSMNKKAGTVALYLTIFAVYFYVGAVQLAIDSERWTADTNVISILFSLTTLVNFLQFFVGSLALTSIVILYKYFRPNSEIKGEVGYFEYIKKFSLSNSLILTIAFPLMIAVGTVVKTKFALSFMVFAYASASILLLLFISSLIYLMLKENHLRFSLAVLFLYVVVFSLLIIKDQYAFDTSTKKQFEILAANYTEYETNLKAEFGIGDVAISGADIYNGRCIACHAFDKKLVGPPYNETLPKYDGKKDQLVKYILNPVKIDPEYPPMPNQGLKPKEAEAIADYILTIYKK
ncbi:MAG: cytochrome c class I [Ignavibacteria bacterium]|nr:MAG: cytochrome c class I [Ignavibacteria bacterium]KAF0159709.1 MAG: cytochrome c class I [Ignavibacteria bacterium]